jgi:hypothetical protein
LVLARVITSLGSLPEVGVAEVEGLFAADLAFLQDLYGIINFGDQADVEALQASVLPADVDLPDDAVSAETDAVEGADVDEEPVSGRRSRRSRVEEVTSGAS